MFEVQLLDKIYIINEFYDKLVKEGYEDKLKILKYPSDEYEGYSYIKIYNKNASKKNMLQGGETVYG